MTCIDPHQKETNWDSEYQRLRKAIAELAEEWRILEARALAAEGEVTRLSWLLAGGKEVDTGSEAVTEYPVGDGITDDTAAIQALIDGELKI